MGGPTPPESLPKYLVEGCQKQDADTLRDLAAYARDLAAEYERQAQAELENQADRERDDIPDEWAEDDWTEAVESAETKADITAAKGTLTVKHIDGRGYYYLQWREGDKIKSQYVAPVVPADAE